MKQLLTTLIIFTSVVSSVLGRVISIEAVNKNANAVNYESPSQTNKSMVECLIRYEIGKYCWNWHDKSK